MNSRIATRTNVGSQFFFGRGGNASASGGKGVLVSGRTDSQPAEYRFVLADGRIRHMESSGGVIRDSQGRPLRATAARAIGIANEPLEHSHSAERRSEQQRP